MTNVIDGETTFAIFIFRVWLKVWNCIHFQMNNKTYFDGYLSLLFQLKKKDQENNYYHKSMGETLHSFL